MEIFKIKNFQIRVWDAGNKVNDRYTIGIKESRNLIHYFGMNNNPSSGFSQYLGSNLDDYSPNKKWGKEIDFHQLPFDTQQAVIQRINLSPGESICPRCFESYTTPPAISRRANVNICSGCGKEEALIDAKLINITSLEKNFTRSLKSR